MTITIRNFQESDTPQILQLMSEFGDYIESVDPKKRTSYKDGGAEYFTTKMLSVCTEKQGAVLVACDGDKVVGFISGYVDEQDEDEEMEAIPAIPGVLAEFFVTESYRGHKVGKRLLSQMEAYLQKQGCTIIRFPVFAPNTLARKFYEHEGYIDWMIYVMKELKKAN